MENNPSKKSFFTALEQLDDSNNLSDDEEDPLERLIARSRPSHIRNRTATLESAPPESVPLLRVNSDPQPSSTGTEIIVAEGVSPRRSAFLDQPEGRILQRSRTTGTMPGFKTGGPPPSKKRRINSIKAVPEGQQIFKALVFCE